MDFATIANIGDRIKAFDFEPMEGREDAYAIGKVIDKDDYSYTVAVEEDTYAPKGVRLEIKVPFRTFFGTCANRVSLVA